MLHIEALPVFFAANGAPHGVPPATIYTLNRMPDKPDNLVAITEVPGLLVTSVEEATDQAAIQLRVRSHRNDAKTARDIAHALDQVLMDANIRPFYIDGFLVITAGRVGGSPAYLTTDDQGRISYVCNYYLTIQRA